MNATVVATFLNEEKTVANFIDALLSQSILPNEIILADGGSTDKTVEVVNKYIKNGAPIKFIQKKGNRSVGRNEAIRRSRNSIILVTDAGTIADKNWFEEITKPFEDRNIKVVAGFFKAKPETFFEKVSSTLMLSDHDNIDINTWLPSTRSLAFKKEAWKKVGGFPEHTKYNEDTPFDLSLKKAGYKFAFAPKAFVYWRPRSDLRGFFKQYHAYSIGDGLDLIHSSAYSKKALLYFTGFCLLAIGFWFWSSWVFLLLGILAYFFRRDLRVIRKIPDVKTLLLAPVLTVTFDLAELTGYFEGLLKSNEKGK